jgi:hypothetical protein
MQTSDKKDFLAGKVISGGIANTDRALEAARLSLGTSVADAIEKANRSVADVKPAFEIKSEGFVVPLTPMFILR